MVCAHLCVGMCVSLLNSPCFCLCLRICAVCAHAMGHSQVYIHLTFIHTRTLNAQIAVHGQGIPMDNKEFVVPSGVNAGPIPQRRKMLESEQSDDLDEEMVCGRACVCVCARVSSCLSNGTCASLSLSVSVLLCVCASMCVCVRLHSRRLYGQRGVCCAVWGERGTDPTEAEDVGERAERSSG